MAWDSSQCSHSLRHLLLQQMAGPAPAVLLIQASSVPSAAALSLNQSQQLVPGPAPVVLLIQASSALSAAALSQQTQKAGPAAAVLLTRASSALNVVQKNQQVLRFISAISAAGSQRIRTIRQNSVQNVVTHLMIMILSEHNRGLLVQYF